MSYKLDLLKQITIFRTITNNTNLKKPTMTHLHIQLENANQRIISLMQREQKLKMKLAENKAQQREARKIEKALYKLNK